MTGALAAALAVAFVSSYLGVLLMRKAAHRRGWFAHPTDRGLHERPTPFGGGAAIVIVTTAGSAVLLAINGLFDRRWSVVLVAALAVAVVSWLDDLRPLSNTIRFGVHVAAAGAAITQFGCIDELAFARDHVIGTGLLACPLAVIWIAGLTNAYNFMDGSDGIAGLQAVVAGAGIAIVAIRVGASDVALVALLVAAASAGFLIPNWSPASIFMGDVGSAFLGYLLAVLVLAAARQNATALLAGVLTLWPFVFDTTFTFIRRLRKRENVFAGHRSHLYQRLIQAGHSHAAVALLYFTLASLGVAAAVAFLSRRGALIELLPLAVVPAAAFTLWLYVVRVERARAARVSAASRSISA